MPGKVARHASLRRLSAVLLAIWLAMLPVDGADARQRRASHHRHRAAKPARVIPRAPAKAQPRRTVAPRPRNAPRRAAVDVMAALLGTMLDNPRLAGDQVGAILLDRDGKVRFARNADRRLVPASTRKLLVTAAALSLLGPEASFSTRVVAGGYRDGDRLVGDLALVGGGDPGLDGAGLDDLAAQIAATGLRTVTGNLVGDASLFAPAEDFGAGWAQDDEGFAYASRVSALVVDRNAASESVASLHPVSFALERFRGALAIAGIRVLGSVSPGPAPAGATQLARRESAPLKDLVARTNKPSDNLFAEILLRHLGAVATPAPQVSTAHAGLDAEAAWLGWPREAYRVVDGSGLSRYDLLTPRQLADILQRMKDNADFVASLPVAGVDGTLAERFGGTRAQGRIRAKTGTMSGISTLAGYVGDHYVFAFMINGHVGPLAPVRAIQDAMCLALTDGVATAAIPVASASAD